MQSALLRSNSTRPDIYDLETGIDFPFTYCRISAPRTEWLRRQGAEWVLESWSHGEKSAFTGLRPTKDPGIYTGDLLLKDGKHRIRAEKTPTAILITVLSKRNRVKQARP